MSNIKVRVDANENNYKVSIPTTKNIVVGIASSNSSIIPIQIPQIKAVAAKVPTSPTTGPTVSINKIQE